MQVWTVVSGKAAVIASGTADHDLIDIAADPDLLMAIGDRDRVIVGVIAHERLRADPAARLVAGVERGGRQRAHRGQIALKPLTDRLLVTTKPAREARAALLFKVGVEIVPAGKMGDRHHVVTAGVANHPFYGALVVPLPGSTIAIPKQVMRLQAAKQCGADARAVRLDLRDQAAVVVVEHRLRHASTVRASSSVSATRHGSSRATASPSWPSGSPNRDCVDLASGPSPETPSFAMNFPATPAGPDRPSPRTVSCAVPWVPTPY